MKARRVLNEIRKKKEWKARDVATNLAKQFDETKDT